MSKILLRDFLNKYRTGDIVFPSVILRNCIVERSVEQDMCECGVEGLVRELYMFRCPLCGNITGHRFYSMNEVKKYLDDNYGEVSCQHCDQYFVPRIDNGITNSSADLVLYYEKL